MAGAADKRIHLNPQTGIYYANHLGWEGNMYVSRDIPIVCARFFTRFASNVPNALDLMVSNSPPEHGQWVRLELAGEKKMIITLPDGQTATTRHVYEGLWDLVAREGFDGVAYLSGQTLDGELLTGK